MGNSAVTFQNRPVPAQPDEESIRSIALSINASATLCKIKASDIAASLTAIDADPSEPQGTLDSACLDYILRSVENNLRQVEEKLLQISSTLGV